MPIMEQIQTINTVKKLSEQQDPNHPGAFVRTLTLEDPLAVPKGHQLRFTLSPDESVVSGVQLKGATVVFDKGTPLRSAFGTPVFEAHFQKQEGGDLVWLSGPLNHSGSFHFNLNVELEDDPAKVPSQGNRIVDIWPMMVVDDDPPD